MIGTSKNPTAADIIVLAQFEPAFIIIRFRNDIDFLKDFIFRKPELMRVIGLYEALTENPPATPQHLISSLQASVSTTFTPIAFNIFLGKSIYSSPNIYLVSVYWA